MLVRTVNADGDRPGRSPTVTPVARRVNSEYTGEGSCPIPTLDEAHLNVRNLFTSGRITDFWNVVREVDPQTVIREAEQPVRLVICGSQGVGKRTLAAALVGGEIDGRPETNVAIDVCDMPDDVPLALPSADLYLYVTTTDRPFGALERGHLGQLIRKPGRVVCAVNRRDESDDGRSQSIQRAASDAFGLTPDRVLSTLAIDTSSVQRELIPGLVRQVPHLALPLGRRLAAVRDPAADCLIADTARVNAEFAVVSSLPALVPVVGTLTSMGTDMVVLTKNQVMLLLKLALIYQRPVDNRLQVLTEIAPIVGGAFFWRAAARSLIAMVPGPFALAPRAAVAYVGTYVTGKAGQYYYRKGLRPSTEILDSFRDEAIRQISEASLLLGQIGRHLRLS